VNLDQEIEAEASATDLSETLGAEIERLLLQVTHQAETELLSALGRGVTGSGLHLPPMPQVILRVQRLTSSSDFHMADLIREIELDPSLVTKIVGIANSPFYSGMGTASSVQDAIVRIGIVETRNILMAIMMRSRVFRVPGLEDLTRGVWEHSLAASVTIRSLAAELGLEPDRAFLAGLVQDVGKVIVLSVAGEVQRSSRGKLRPDPLALQRVMQELHPLLSAVVTQSWHLEEEITSAIRHHHDPASAPCEARQLAAVLAVGDELAHQVVCDSGQEVRDGEVAAARLEPLGLSPEQAQEVVAEACEAFEELRKIL
jgi:HD-like signal output (HDOD) protein